MLEFIVIPKDSKQTRDKLVREITHIVIKEFGFISQPCYYCKVEKFWKDLVEITGLTKEDVLLYKSKIPEKYKSRMILSDNKTIFCIFGVMYYLKIKKPEIARVFMYLMTLKFYASRYRVHFPNFCNPELWNLSLDRISKKHNYSIHSSISNSLMYISDYVFKQIEQRFKLIKNENDFWELCNYMVYSERQRVAQSLRAFANKYFELQKNPEIGVKKKEVQDTGEEKSDTIVNIPGNVASSITTYAQIDKMSLGKAITNSGIKGEIGQYIVNRMSRVDYESDIRLILVLFNKLIELNKFCDEKNKNVLTRKVLSDTKIQNYSPKDIIFQFVKKIDQDYILQTVDKNQLIVFMCNYLFYYTRNKVCR